MARSDWKWDRIKEHISPLKNRLILDVGCGSGYLCAAFYEMVKNKDDTAHVVGIDRITELTEFAVKNLSKNYMK